MDLKKKKNVRHAKLCKENYLVPYIDRKPFKLHNAKLKMSCSSQRYVYQRPASETYETKCKNTLCIIKNCVQTLLLCRGIWTRITELQTSDTNVYGQFIKGCLSSLSKTCSWWLLSLTRVLR